jgi:hypothetical protein
MVMAKKQTTLQVPTGILSICGTSSNITTTTSGPSLFYNTVSGFSSFKTKYHVLGEDVEVSGYQDGHTTIIIATLNVLGKPFLDELHKNNTFLPTEIEEYLEKKFKWLERDKKIDDIIN